jgi:hypothetical protein
MPLKRWDHGACITYGKAQPVVRVGLPTALVTTFRAAGAARDGATIAIDAVGPQGKAQR